MIFAIAKIFIALALVAVLIMAAGFSGVLFSLWPTNVADHSLNITPQVLAELHKLKDERKFGEDKNNLYFGAPNEIIRASAQASVDAVIQSLLTELPANPKRSVVLRTFKSALTGLEQHDSEERDQLLVYLQRIMNVVGITSSGELLNVWRYGFPYGWVQRA